MRSVAAAAARDLDDTVTGVRQEEYIEQLKFEQEEKLEREAAKRKALQQLRGDAPLHFQLSFLFRRCLCMYLYVCALCWNRSTGSMEYRIDGWSGMTVLLPWV